jgi:hypothetical protein
MARRTRLFPVVMVMVAIIAVLTWDASTAHAAACGGTQGGALLLGCNNNTAVDETDLTGTNNGFHVVATEPGSTGLFASGGYYGVHGVGGTYGVAATSENYGVYASGDTGVYGEGASYGVYGTSNNYGLYGQGGTYGVSGAGSTGVFGTSSTGCSLFGCGKGLSGTNTSTGYGVLGSSANGIGVGASSGSGTALLVTGKATFSRSGTATVAGTAAFPKKSVLVPLPTTAKSMMTATLQKYISGVWVVAAVPTKGKTGAYVGFTIYLNTSVTTSVGPIAWQVIEKP